MHDGMNGVNRCANLLRECRERGGLLVHVLVMGKLYVFSYAHPILTITMGRCLINSIDNGICSSGK